MQPVSKRGEDQHFYYLDLCAMDEVFQGKLRYQNEIQSMMYTFGDVRNTLPETSELVEEIVHSSLIILTIEAARVAQKRGSRTMSVEDIIFIIRHDQTKVNRITDFLSWKDVRRNVKQANGGAGDDVEVVEEDKLKPPKRKQIKLSFDFLQSLTDVLKEEEFEEEGEIDHFHEIEQRLKEADDITRSMTREEYVEYAECRQASFTFKKAKKFRDWLNFGAYIDMKPNDELLEVLGYIAWETVCRLTKTALLIKKDAKLASSLKKEEDKGVINEIGSISGPGKEKKRARLFSAMVNGNENVGSQGSSTEVVPTEERTPIGREHVREAYRRMQLIHRPHDNFRPGMIRSSVNIW